MMMTPAELGDPEDVDAATRALEFAVFINGFTLKLKAQCR